jgi:NHL repeat
MLKVEHDLGAGTPADLSPAPIEVLIPAVRQRTRRRRLRNLAVVPAVAALVVGVGVIAFTGGGSPAVNRTGQTAAPSYRAPTSTKTPAVSPKTPASLAVGPNGELYIADTTRHQVIERLPNGRFEVVAGTGIAGDSGDGGSALQAEINGPGSLAIAPNGALYFAQWGRTTMAGGMLSSVVREVTPNGKITTIVGQDPNCGAVPSGSTSVPAKSAEFSGAELAIGSGGRLDISTTVCPNILNNLGGFLQLTSSGELVRTSVDAVPGTPGYCTGGTAGPGFVVFGCSSGARRGPRLMVVRSNGSTENYLDIGSQMNAMSSSNGTVVAIHNGAVVRVEVNALETLATPRQLSNLVPDASPGTGGGGIAIDRHGTVYVNQDFWLRHRGCADAIFEIHASGRIRLLWRSAPSRTCY